MVEESNGSNSTPVEQAVVKSTSLRATAPLSKKDSRLMNTTKSVPIVDLQLEELTYQPFTSTGAAKSGKGSSNDRTVVLNKVSTRISPYKLTAWIGPSGSGKTSLTSVVAGLVSPSDMEGAILVNGEEGRVPKQMVGVVWQDDLLLSNLTVEETIFFAARLKTPSDVSDQEVRELVEDVMATLGLSHIRDNLIGSSLANQPGISGGERKRTAVATELVVRPSLILLDEPTSGLDATTAHALMTTLKDLASLGHAIAVVIHQPRTDIFKLLDHLLLMSKGRVVYDGDASKARTYLESLPEVDELPPETGIADWIMDTIILDQSRKENAVLARHWSNRKAEFAPVTSTVPGALKRELSTLAELNETPRKFEASFGKQLALLANRTLKQRRGEKFTTVSMLLTCAYIFFSSLFWWRLPDTTGYIFEKNSLLFFMLIAQGNSIVVGSVSVFQRDRALLRRERAKKLYGVLPYFLAKTASDMTNNVMMPVCYGIVLYWTANLRPDAGAFFKFLLAYYMTLSTAQHMGFFMSIAIPNMQIALLLAPSITLFFFIMGGFYLPLANMHWGVKWASYLSFARYGYSALLVNEYGGRFIECDGSDESSVSIGDADDCPYYGDTVFESLGVEGAFANYWFNMAMLLCLSVVLLTAAYVQLLRSK
eukprot:Nitzschia sp. Nitz4//scaffold209_size42451//31343//33301//NITZ4_007362-RA/size42451-processed-gene-0.37-mRNA-1//-1//CDS//3329541712//5006//frame0